MDVRWRSNGRGYSDQALRSKFFVFLNPHNTTFKWSLLQMKNTGV